MTPPDPRTLLERAAEAPGDAAAAARALPLLDLTSLNDDDTPERIVGLCERARAHGVAAVCVYPRFVALARERLDGSAVRVATVVNFPDGSDDLGRATEETAAALADGAHEIDAVIPITAVMAGDVASVTDMTEALRGTAPDVTLKIILETGVLEAPDRIASSARAAVMAGCDMLKTSTGKAEVGATLEAAAVMLAVCAESGGRVGFKAAGGVRTVAQAAAYLYLADEQVRPGWATPDRFRFGASGLLDAVLQTLGGTGGGS